jgi:hypothetical protein
MSTGKLHATLELNDVDEVPLVRIGAYGVPLESDPSVVSH